MASVEASARRVLVRGSAGCHSKARRADASTLAAATRASRCDGQVTTSWQLVATEGPMPDRIVLLGAEKQAATSAALAYPERQFRFVSDQPVLDGWDLPNVTFTHGTPGNVPLEPGEKSVALCPRWLMAAEQKPLSEVMFRLAEATPSVLPVSSTPIPGHPCIVKGDRWHRPDGTITGTDLDPADVGDPYGCGTLYQPMWPAEQTILVVGRVREVIQLAAFAIHAESCARDDVLAAGETISLDRNPGHRLLSETLAALKQLRHQGFFAFNWLRRGDECRLTSFRPAPRAVFGTLRKADIDLFSHSSDLQTRTGRSTADAGHRFVADITYTSYRRLVA
jgi:hypothetical protein